MIPQSFIEDLDNFVYICLTLVPCHFNSRMINVIKNQNSIQAEILYKNNYRYQEMVSLLTKTMDLL